MSDGEQSEASEVAADEQAAGEDAVVEDAAEDADSDGDMHEDLEQQPGSCLVCYNRTWPSLQDWLYAWQLARNLPSRRCKK